MKLIPTKQQWSQWSLPSKASYFSAVFGVVTFVITVTLQLINLDAIRGILDQPTDWADVSPSTKSSFADIFFANPSYVKGRDDLQENLALAKETCGLSYTPAMREFLLARNIAWQILPRSDIANFRDQQKSILHYFIYDNIEFSSQFKETFPVIEHYRDQVRAIDRKGIIQAIQQLNAISEFETIFGGERMTSVVRGLGISPYPNKCMQTFVYNGGVTIDLWMSTFWLRRENEGTFRLYSDALDALILHIRE